MSLLMEGKHVTKSYSRGDKHFLALDDLNFTLEEGEILGIVGESGSGKSTLLRQISGLEHQTSGEIYFQGNILPKKRNLAHYRSIQMIFQDAIGSFHPRKKISNSIMDSANRLMGRNNGVSLEELAESVGLSAELTDRYPGQLSGGQCQRLAIARAIASKPAVLLCDEVTSALDVSSQAMVLNLLSDLRNQRGTSMIFVAHDLSAVSCLCDRIIVMQNGKMVETGKTSEVITNPKEDYTKNLLGSVLEL